MAERAVFAIEKDANGDITALHNHNAPWSPRLKHEAITDIATDLHSYTAAWPDGRRTAVRVVQGPHGKYLRTDRAPTPRNDLTDLPAFNQSLFVAFGEALPP